MHKKKGIPAVQLPAALPIGFTGHRKLEDESRSRALIFDLVQEQKKSIPVTIYGVSSTAAGGDLLFAEVCMELAIPLRIFLPAPKERFREDFDEATWRRAEQVFARAISIE